MVEGAKFSGDGDSSEHRMVVCDGARGGADRQQGAVPAYREGRQTCYRRSCERSRFGKQSARKVQENNLGWKVKMPSFLEVADAMCTCAENGGHRGSHSH